MSLSRRISSLVDSLMSSRRFRTKFMIVATLGVLLALGSSAGTALFNVTRLKREASSEMHDSLARANQEYLENYINTNALRLGLLFEQTFSELRTTASIFQTLIDNPNAGDELGKLADRVPLLQDTFEQDKSGKWSQNVKKHDDPSVISVWHYMLDSNGQPLPEVAEHEVRKSAVFDLFAPSFLKNGSRKLQIYYMGPRERPVMRLAPYLDLAQTFDKTYPGHTEKNMWDSFFPGVLEGWEQWIKEPGARPVQGDDVTVSYPYIDAATGSHIVSFFHPLWSQDRKRVAGAVAIDITLDQAFALIQNVRIKNTGFAFLALATGNVLAINQENEGVLGIGTREASGGAGLTGLERNLKDSSHPDIARLVMPENETPTFSNVKVTKPGAEEPETYTVVLRRLPPMNFWHNEKIGKQYWVLGFVAPESELFSTMITAQEAIQGTTRRILIEQIAVAIISLLAILLGVAWVAKRITSNLVLLSEAAFRLMNKDYSVRVTVESQDEIGQLGVAFNAMASDIEAYTNNLEELVSERTRALEKANQEISELNAKLAQENIRLGAELNVARQLQLMVLPAPQELEQITELDIAGYMAPADEVGGDYYDVLRNEGLVKIGIGDVTGHGLESGVLMLMVQTAVRTLLATGEQDPTRFLSIVNKVIYQNIQRINSTKNMSLTLLDYSCGTIQLTGQHEDLIIVRKDGSLERFDTMGLGMPIGLDLDIEDFISSAEIKMDPGDLVALFSDGITEAEDASSQQYGIDRLCEVIKRNHERSSKEIKDAIIEDVLAHIGYNKVYDDITVLVIKRV